MDPLQQPVAVGGRRAELVIVGEAVGPAAAQHIDREVLVDHDHRQDLVDSVGVVGMLAAQERIGGQVGIERGLGLAGG